MNRPPERLNTMKLPTTPLPATLQDMKLQGDRSLSRSFQQLTKKLLSMGPVQVTRSSSGGQSAAESTQALINKTDNKSTKLFLNLLLVRPWVLVLGFWLFSMLVGSLALGGMLSPRKLTQALPEPTALDTSHSGNAAINVEKAADELAIEGGEQTEADPETGDAVSAADGETGAVAAADSSAGFPVLPLVVLVGSCAAGSLLISRRRAMMRMSAARAQGRARQGRTNKGRQSQGRQVLKTKAPKNQTTRNQTTKNQPLKNQSLKRQGALDKAARGAKAASSTGLSPKKRRQRVRRGAVATQKNGQNAHMLASRTNAQQSAQMSGVRKSAASKETRAKSAKQRKSALSARVQAGRVQAKRASGGAKRRDSRVSMRAASRRQPVVSVVPASERHALDWAQGSLAHQMDVRHQRRAM